MTDAWNRTAAQRQGERMNHQEPEHEANIPREENFHPDPIVQFRRWFEEVEAAGIAEANAMVLATASPNAEPSARTVLLKEADERGFVFYTNYESRKGKELELNPRASLVFFWKELQRQVRVEGTVERLPREESALYFATRPRESQLGAWASFQSRVLADRRTLMDRYAEMERRFRGMEIPLPDHWGGFRLVPRQMEFWIGRSGRLHDRFRYTRTGDRWRIDRLYP
jgi:pyridoxamine 5'-phosphate oxidase